MAILHGGWAKDFRRDDKAVVFHAHHIRRHNTKVLDLTADHDAVLAFIENAPGTSGGDADECYELVFRRAKQMSWSGKNGAFVLIGDANPHEPDYLQNTEHLDWREELQDLCAKAKVFGMQCMRNGGSNLFWDAVAERAGTKLLVLNDFSESSDILGAVAYAASGDKEAYDRYSTKVSALRCRSADFSSNLTSLRDSMEGKADLP